ncbi:MAG: 50S ribosomal protein L9 [Pseudomonadota bacterium]
MEIILLERIGKLGQMGDQVTVKDGYARNFLLPQGKALRATKNNIERFNQDKAQLEARNLELKKEAEDVANRVADNSFIVIRQASESGQLYGSVSTRDIAEIITAGGCSISRNQVLLDRPIKTLGLHQVRLSLHPEVDVKVIVNVARSEEEAELQTKGEDVTALRDAKEEEEPEVEIEEMFEEGALKQEAEETSDTEEKTEE